MNVEQWIDSMYSGYSPLCFETYLQNGKTCVIKVDRVQYLMHSRNKKTQKGRCYNTLQKHKVGMNTKGNDGQQAR